MKENLGLTHAQAATLLARHGPNAISKKTGHSPLSILLGQFTSVLVILLMVAALASLFLGDVLDGIFILLIVILNGILGFIQEYKAEKAIEALRSMTVATVRVLRGGVEQKIESTLLVPGDIVLLEEGDKVPADCELIESHHVEVNESSLTGESMPVEKNLTEEAKRFIYLGTIMVKGRARARVTTTGMQTKFGQIAATLSEIKNEDTPLQKKLDVLGKQLGLVAFFASSIVFVIGMYEKHPLIEMLLTSISLAVAAVPEGLPAVITITLAVGMQRMARKRAILRKLSSIEALGGTTVIATDKTGTLTRNEMQVVQHWINGKIHQSLDKFSVHSAMHHALVTIGVVCNNASLVFTHDKNRYDVLGDATEGALLLFAKAHELESEKIKQSGSLVEEFAFDPTLKMMTVLWKDKKGIHVYTKGAPENVLEKSTHIEKDDGVHPLTVADRNHVAKAFESFAKEGLRVIALAYRDVKTAPEERGAAEEKLIFLGFVGIADPARPEVKDAIAIAESAGIRTMMITGDNELTANAIATKIGLIKKGEEIMTGAQFAMLSDKEMLIRLPSIRIFARTTPDQKLRIVRLLQQSGHVVAVTGDGVNDALALKQSDVGVAMGITGTDVAKEAADMVLTDDNYATLVTAVEEGRVIFDNIKSAIKYLVGCNIGEIFAVLIGMMMGWPLILSPLQLLYINLVTDGLPAIVLAISAKRDGIMNRKPRQGKQMFDGMDMRWFIEVSVLTAITTLFAFWIGNNTGNLYIGRALAFTTIILVQHFILLDVWTRGHSVMRSGILSDKLFLFAFFAPLCIQPLLLYVPALSNIFKLYPLTSSHWLFVITLSLVVLIASEIRKIMLNRVHM